MDLQVIIHAIPEIATQLLAFVLVFLILKKYAFGAVFSAIEERQKAIKASFDEAQAKKTEYESLERQYLEKLKNITDESRAKLNEAIEEGSRVAQEIKDKARQDALATTERAKADVQQEIAKAKVTLKRDMVGLATQMAGQILQKKLSEKENEAFVKNILKGVDRS